MSRLQVIKGGVGSVSMGLADYVLLDETGEILTKKKTILVGKNTKGEPVPILRRWFISTTGGNFLLDPCFYLPDPTRPAPSYIILCETKDLQDRSLKTNHRAALRKAMDLRRPTSKLLWFGFEQQYILEDPQEKEPNIAERRFLTTERHMGACFDAGLMLHSAWNPLWTEKNEFKVGVRGFPQDLDPDPPTALVVTDHLVAARYLLEKTAAEKGLSPKWDGLTLFVSTPQMREPNGDHTQEVSRLADMLKIKGFSLRAVPDPEHGGVMCLQVNRDQHAHPYKMALEVLEAIWPVDNTAENLATAEENDE